MRLAFFVMFGIAPALLSAQSWIDCGSTSTTQICFDLSREGKIAGTIFLPSKFPRENTTVALNFATRNERGIPFGLARVGTFDDRFTLVSAFGPEVGEAKAVLEFEAVFTSEDFDFLNYQAIDYGLLYAENGLERRFVYVFPDVTKIALPDGSVIQPQEIALILPAKAVGVEISGTGKIELPQRIREHKDTRIYGGNINLAGGESAIKILYRVAATSAQKIFAEYAVKFFVLISAPLVAMVMIQPIASDQASRRKVVLWFFVCIQTLILAGYSYYVYSEGVELDLRTGLDLTLGVLGLLFGAYVAWEKSKSERPA